MIPVIICGGFGTKLWPVSREHKPKHFLPLISGKSTFQLNYEALRTKFAPDEIYVSTNEDQMKLAQKQAPEIPAENYILEPERRNHGPATGLVAATLYKKGMKNEPFMIIQADDVREPVENFIKMIEDCDALARKDNKYITGGFKPDFPIMGVDYLIKGERVSPQDSVGIYKVANFIWRGTKEDTEKLVSQGEALVHTNHTCMTPENFLEMYKKYKPEWYEPLMEIINGAEVRTEYLKMPEGPIEDVTQKVHKAGESLVVELPFKWFDFGTFESLSKYLKERNLYKVGDNVVDLDGKDNFVMLDDPNKIIGIVGLDDIVIVDTGDVVLVCSKKETGKVGEVRKEVEKRELALV